MKNNLQEISKQMVKRYSDRYNKLGYHIHTLGWGNKEQQSYRFLQTLESEIDFNNNVILDIGCGFGDYYKFLKNSNIYPSKYVGWDINPDLINEAKTIYRDDEKACFEIQDLTTNNENTTIANIAVMLGVLNLNFKEKMDNYKYSELIINNAFKKVKKLLIVDFLSTSLDKNYPKEDFVFYHNPAKIINIALKITSNIVLKHNYMPIPQKEFMLFLYK